VGSFRRESKNSDESTDELRLRSLFFEWAVRLQGLAEIKRTAGQRVGQERNPDGIGQIAAGPHYHYQICGAGEVEFNLIAPNAKSPRQRSLPTDFTPEFSCAPAISQQKFAAGEACGKSFAMAGRG
jgi:hypothetical protein